MWMYFQLFLFKIYTVTFLPGIKPTWVPPRESIDEKKLSPPQSLLAVPLSDSSSKSSSNISDRVKKLFDSLEVYDSLYLCPMDKPFPDVVSSRLRRRCFHRYEIKDYYGVTRFYAAELTPCCCYCCCSNERSFQIYMYDLWGELVFESVRSCSTSLCIAGVDCCCVGGVETTANFRHGENYIGSVLSHGNCGTPTYRIHNEYWDEVYYIRGPNLGFIFPCRLCCIKQFSICLPKTDTSVGKVMYGYDGLQEDRIPNPRTVGIIFPPRCSAETKACLLTAGFMLDVTYYQRRGCTIHRILRFIFHLGLVIAVIFTCFYIYGRSIQE